MREWERARALYRMPPSVRIAELWKSATREGYNVYFTRAYRRALVEERARARDDEAREGKVFHTSLARDLVPIWIFLVLSLIFLARRTSI